MNDNTNYKNKKSIIDLSETEKGRLRRLLNFSGIIFLLSAGFMVLNPETVTELFGLDKMTQSFFAIALITAAVGDFLIARLLFGKKDRA